MDTTELPQGYMFKWRMRGKCWHLSCTVGASGSANETLYWVRAEDGGYARAVTAMLDLLGQRRVKDRAFMWKRSPRSRAAIWRGGIRRRYPFQVRVTEPDHQQALAAYVADYGDTTGIVPVALYVVSTQRWHFSRLVDFRDQTSLAMFALAGLEFDRIPTPVPWRPD